MARNGSPASVLLSPGDSLLNFYRRPMYLAVPLFGIPVTRFASVEHYFQTMKVFYLQWPHSEDQFALFKQIQGSPSPAGAKHLGRSLPINPLLWNGARVGHMIEGMIAKFSQHSDLRVKLEATDGLELREHSQNRIWGDGLDGSGLNLAGQCLMLTRELLINGPE